MGLYLNKDTNLKSSSKNKIAVSFLAFVTVLAVTLGLFSAVPVLGGKGVQTANAGVLYACGTPNELGSGFDRAPWKNSNTLAPGATGGNRTWTLQEAFGNGLGYVLYTGEGEGDWLLGDVGTERGKEFSKWQDNLTKLESERSWSNCVTLGRVVNSMSNLGLGIANQLSGLSSFFVTSAFNSQIICTDPDPAANSSCINLLRIIGGNSNGVVTNGNDGGLIGALTAGLYIPLLVMIVAVSGLWVMWRGIVKRQYREALFGTLWILGSVIFGLTLLFRPALLAKAPMAISNSIVSCVLGAFSGNNCFDSSTDIGGVVDAASVGTTPTSAKICTSNASVPTTEQAALAVNSMTCQIWRSFVLEPFAQGQYGRSFDELDTSNADTAKAINEAGFQPSTYCVNLRSSTSWANMNPGLLDLNSNGAQVCNLAAYHMFLKVESQQLNTEPNGTLDTATTPNTHWYKLILTSANDAGMWLSFTSVGQRMGMGFLAAVTAVAGSIVIVVLSVFALLYYLTSILMIAFAPLFFLLGVHPGRGKKIFFGWSETVISNILKYMASAFFLVIAVAFYGGVLSSTSNIGLSFLFVIILSFALFMYRKEVVGLMGQVNMGGERLSSAALDKVRDRGSKIGDKSKRLAGATAGAVLGASMASGSLKKEEISLAKDRAQAQEGFSDLSKKEQKKKLAEAANEGEKVAKKKNAGMKRAAFGEGLRRELKVGGKGFLGQAMSQTLRQYERTSQDNKRDLAEEARHARESAAQMRHEEEVAAGVVDRQTVNVEKAAVTVEASGNALSEKNDLQEKVQAVQDGALSKIATQHPEFAQMQEIINRMERLRIARADAVGMGDNERVAKIDAMMSSSSEELNIHKQNISRGDEIAGKKAYSQSLHAEIKANNYDVDAIRGQMSKEGRESYLADVQDHGINKAAYNSAYETLENDIARLNGLRVDSAEQSAWANHLVEAHQNINAGEIQSTSDNTRIAREFEARMREKGPEYVQTYAPDRLNEGKVGIAGLGNEDAIMPHAAQLTSNEERYLNERRNLMEGNDQALPDLDIPDRRVPSPTPQPVPNDAPPEPSRVEPESNAAPEKGNDQALPDLDIPDRRVPSPTPQPDSTPPAAAPVNDKDATTQRRPVEPATATPEGNDSRAENRTTTPVQPETPAATVPPRDAPVNPVRSDVNPVQNAGNTESNVSTTPSAAPQGENTATSRVEAQAPVQAAPVSNAPQAASTPTQAPAPVAESVEKPSSIPTTPTTAPVQTEAPRAATPVTEARVEAQVPSQGVNVSTGATAEQLAAAASAGAAAALAGQASMNAGNTPVTETVREVEETIVEKTEVRVESNPVANDYRPAPEAPTRSFSDAEIQAIERSTQEAMDKRIAEATDRLDRIAGNSPRTNEVINSLDEVKKASATPVNGDLEAARKTISDLKTEMDRMAKEMVAKDGVSAREMASIKAEMDKQVASAQKVIDAKVQSQIEKLQSEARKVQEISSDASDPKTTSSDTAKDSRVETRTVNDDMDISGLIDVGDNGSDGAEIEFEDVFRPKDENPRGPRGK